MVKGDHLQQGRIAVLYGPLVLAADQAYVPADATSLSRLAAAGEELAMLGLRPDAVPEDARTWPGAKMYRINAVARRSAADEKANSLAIGLVPFADAGARGTAYKVWLPLPGVGSTNLLWEGRESRSRTGNLHGSIIDDPPSPVVTWDNRPADEDWFAVTLDRPVNVRRVCFQHGRSFHDGGWFDASAGKPRVQVQKQKDGAWETVGVLEKYPAATATDNKKIREGKDFTLELAEPVSAFGVRVIGRPACGDRPGQSFASCGGLQAFEK